MPQSLLTNIPDNLMPTIDINIHLTEQRQYSEQLEKCDGAEQTAPSVGGEPIAKSEPQRAADTTENLELVTSEKPKVKEGDIFDNLIALGRTLNDLTPSQKILTVLPVRKPKKDEWVRCHSGIATPVNIYESSETRETYLILPAVLEAFETVVRHVRMTLTVNYAGEVFIWPVPIPLGAKPHAAHVSAFAAAEAATKSWIRIAWIGNAYEVSRRQNNAKNPEWPAEIKDASSMLRFACKAGGIEIIDSPAHPVACELLGLS